MVAAAPAGSVPSYPPPCAEALPTPVRVQKVCTRMSAVTESISKITEAVQAVLQGLIADKMRRLERQCEGTVIKGYWVGEIVRIDISTKK